MSYKVHKTLQNQNNDILLKQRHTIQNHSHSTPVTHDIQLFS